MKSGGSKPQNKQKQFNESQHLQIQSSDSKPKKPNSLLSLKSNSKTLKQQMSGQIKSAEDTENSFVPKSFSIPGPEIANTPMQEDSLKDLSSVPYSQLSFHFREQSNRQSIEPIPIKEQVSTYQFALPISSQHKSPPKFREENKSPVVGQSSMAKKRK